MPIVSTVVVNLDDDKMTVQGGDLPGVYNTKQFHLHWGNGSSSPGSEHTVDGKQYLMEVRMNEFSLQMHKYEN